MAIASSLKEDHLHSIQQYCRSALDRAINYLVENSINEKGGWSDFATNRSGESTSWVTAYVLWQVGTLLPPRLQQDSFRALLSQRQRSGGWGFSELVPPDCDSTLHALEAILRVGSKSTDLERPIKFVQSHQSKEGGFSTYNDSVSLGDYRNEIGNFNYEGWLQPHVCVSAVALGTLRHFPEMVSEDVLGATTEFLLQTQTREGCWESYWWRSKHFATTRIIQQFYFLNNRRTRTAVTKAISWLLQSANTAGYWDNGYDKEIPCLLSTTSCIKTLLTINMEHQLITKSILWLLEKQNNDGSWSSEPLLQIPPPHIKNPIEITTWRKGGRGVGSYCIDDKRIYTTSTAASAIQHFILRLEDAK